MSKIKVTGVDRLKRKAQRMPEAARKHISWAMEKSAQDLANQMRASVPVDQGDLRDSIIAEPVPNTFGTAWRVRAGGGDVFYARWVEFGTAAGPQASPFFFPTYRMNRTRIRGRISRAYTKAAKEIGAGS